MKIRVVSLKNTSGYFIKIIILVVITVLFGHFFYATKNVKASIKLDSSKISNTMNKIMNTEIILFQDIENSKNSNQQNQKNHLSFSFFQKETINQELELARLTSSQKENNTKNLMQQSQSNILNEEIISDKENINNSESITENNQPAENNSQENITEPTVRSTNRSTFFKSAR